MIRSKYISIIFNIVAQIMLLLKGKKSCGIAMDLHGSKTIEKINNISVNSGRFLSVEAKLAKLDGITFALIIYNANTKNLSDLLIILHDVKDIPNKDIIFGGDFNVIFHINLEGFWRKSMFEEKDNSKIDSNKKKLCDILENSKSQQKTLYFSATSYNKET